MSKKGGKKKQLTKYVAQATGQSTHAKEYAESKQLLEEFLPESLQITQNLQGLNKEDNRLGRMAGKLHKKAEAALPGGTLRNGDHPGVLFVGFETLNTDCSRGVNPNDPKAVYQRACIINAQATMIDEFRISWEKCLRLAVTGFPNVPYTREDGEVKLIPWHEHVRLTLRTMEASDGRLSQKMHRFISEPTAQKRVHARTINSRTLRSEVTKYLASAGLPDELLEKELQQSFNPCFGSGYKANLPLVLSYFKPEKDFEGNWDILEAAIEAVVSRIIVDCGGTFKAWSPEKSLAYLFHKTKGRTETGGRFHCKTEKLGVEGIGRILEDARDITKLTSRIPVELGNRYVPAKNVYAETCGDSLLEKYELTKDVENGRPKCVPKERVTFAVYKAKQVADLAIVYPVQQALREMDWFVALGGHDATFNFTKPEHDHAANFFEFIRQPNVWGASWDFNAHDAHFQTWLKIILKGRNGDGRGVMHRLLPEVSLDYWVWCYEASTQSPLWIEGGLLYPALGYAHGYCSGEGPTNLYEGLAGIIMNEYSLLRKIETVIDCPIVEVVKVEGFLSKLGESVAMMTCGDDDVMCVNHTKFVNAINHGITQLGRPALTEDCVNEISPIEGAGYFAEFNVSPSVDTKKISFFTRHDRVRMVDFTAHQCYVSFNDEWEVTEHRHGYYCFTRALASYVYAEARTPQENLVAEAKDSLGKVTLDKIFNPDTIGFFTGLQYSILSTLYMNPGYLIDGVVELVLKVTPHYGGLYSVMKQGAVERYLKNLNIRDQQINTSFKDSPVFSAMLRAYRNLIAQDNPNEPHEITTIKEWMLNRKLGGPTNQVTLEHFCANVWETEPDGQHLFYPYAWAGWQQLCDMYPDRSDPRGKSARIAEVVIIEEEISDVVEAFGTGALADSILDEMSKLRPLPARNRK